MILIHDYDHDSWIMIMIMIMIKMMIALLKKLKYAQGHLDNLA